jgi:hypothetical protein
MPERLSAGDVLPSPDKIIEVRVPELRSLFNSMDPSPFRNRDLDPSAEEFIVSSGKELARDAPLGLLVHLDRPAGPANEAVVLREALHQFFGAQGAMSRRRLKELFRRGRISLVIGLTFLAAAVGASELIEAWLNPSGFITILRESLVIGGWVAMWRPIEVFLYDGWPIRAEARLYDRLAAMPVRIQYASDEKSDAWRDDWPIVPR